MKYFSTFTGIGGFEVGIHNAWLRSTNKDLRGSANKIRSQIGPDKQRSELGDEGLSCVGYSEIDRYASSVYEKHFEGVKNYGDITKINTDDLPDFDCLVGGFPCQAFSIAGKRGGFNDTRGTLFFDLARILRAKRPRLFVFENVKGLLSHDGGTTFRTIINTIAELGYDAQWQVVNSKNHGVPQNRERVIIVGHLRGTSRPEVFPLEDGNTGNVKQIGNIYNNPYNSQAGRVYDKKGISPTVDVAAGGNRQPKVTDGIKIRRLTPIECERLQAFPDDWTKEGVTLCMGNLCQAGKANACLGHFIPISDTQRYKMCGNAVTTNVIRDVFERIFK